MRPFAAFSLVAGLSAAYAEREANSQLAKVIQLLEGMRTEGKKVMDEEQVLWAEAKQFCAAEIERLDKEIADDKDEKAKAEGDVADAQADQSSLSEMIDGLNTDVASAEKRKAGIKKTRQDEHVAFLRESSDLEESVSALVRASAIMQRQHQKNKKIAQKDALLFLQMPSTRNALPQRALDLLSVKAGQQPAAYESKSGGVTELLDGLEEDFKKQLHECKMAELNGKQNWELETQRLVDIVAKASDDSSDRSASLQERKADEGKAAEIVAASTAELAADSKELRGTTTSCTQKGKSFDDKQQLRQEELEAQAKAIQVLKSVPGGTSDASFFLQLSSSSSEQPNIGKAQVGMWIRNQGAKLNSQALVQLADKIAEDPFGKVKVMIKDMISKIQKEMQQAQGTKNFCELGFSKNKKKQGKLDTAVAKLTSLIDKSAADAAQLKEDVQELNEKIKATRGATATATKERVEEKSLNEKKIKDASDAQTAVSNAMQVLQDFYAKASSATAFLQTEERNIKIGSADWTTLNSQNAAVGYDARAYHQGGEDTFGDSYTGQQDKSSVILGILEVVLSDFAREQSATETSEDASASAFEKFVQDGKVSVAKMTTTSNLKTADAKDAESTLASAKTDLKNTDKQVKAVAEERSSLVPMCPPELGGTKGVVTFAERTAQRKEEIESLRGALEMLSPRDSA